MERRDFLIGTATLGAATAIGLPAIAKEEQLFFYMQSNYTPSPDEVGLGAMAIRIEKFKAVSSHDKVGLLMDAIPFDGIEEFRNKTEGQVFGLIRARNGIARLSRQGGGNTFVFHNEAELSKLKLPSGEFRPEILSPTAQIIFDKRVPVNEVLVAYFGSSGFAGPVVGSLETGWAKSPLYDKLVRRVSIAY